MMTGLGRRALLFRLELKLEAPESNSCVSKCMDFGELWLSAPGDQQLLQEGHTLVRTQRLS